jgi:hypothetical protein
MASILACAGAGPAAAYTDQEISEALMAQAWCSFRYNRHSGYSSSQRAVFGRDGLLRVSNNREGGSSGPAGSYYSQSQGDDVYRWAIRNGALILADDSGQQAFPLDAKLNSSGNIILLVDGQEWSGC